MSNSKVEEKNMYKIFTTRNLSAFVTVLAFLSITVIDSLSGKVYDQEALVISSGDVTVADGQASTLIITLPAGVTRFETNNYIKVSNDFVDVKFEGDKATITGKQPGTTECRRRVLYTHG
jgi:c-di-AMP phosphodiesterase-like protein